MFAKIPVLWVCLLVAAAGSVAYGQGGASGTIVGTVIDPSGGVIAGASVDVTNVGTNITSHTITTSSGDYTVPYLPPGTYQVTVQAPGFQKNVTSNINLVVGQTERVNATLRPGAVAETVEVQGSTVALNTDTPEIGQTVTQRQVDQLPLNGRNFINLLFIGAGAVQTVGEQGQMRQSEGNAISINGGRPESNNYTLDGIVNTDPALVTPSVILSQDAIREFNVLSDNYSAEYGYGANQIDIVSKSGTNDLHGSIFEFLRNDAFDAYTPTPFQTTPSKPRLRQNQFGFVLGGPVYLPKIYDGRNKTFFLANYEGWRITNGYVIQGIVPTPAELGGNFSGLGLPPYDLTTGSACQVALTSTPNPLPCMPGDPNTGAAFPGGIVPTSRFSRLAQASIAANIFPAPTPACVSNPNACGGGINNYQALENLPLHTNQQTYRIDQELGRAGEVFFRYTKADYNNETPQVGQVSPIYSLNTWTEDSTSWAASHTITLGANNVNNFRVGYLHSVAIQGAPPASSSQIAALGLTGVFTNLPSYAAGFPNVVFEAPLLSAAGSPLNSPTTSDIPEWEVADSFAMNRGKHTVAIGFDYRHFVEARDLATNYLGRFVYDNNNILNNSVGGSCTTPSGFCGTGNEVADFLLGYYQTAATFQPGPFSNPKIPGNLHHYVFNYFAPYVQDNWKVTPRLTLNLGLRWDWRNVPYEEHNDLFWIDDQNAAGGLCFANKALLTDGIAPLGNGFYEYCGRRNPADSSKTPFAPRFGFAYRPFGEKTVIRGGYGIFWDSSEAREIDNSGDYYPYIERANVAPNTQAPSIAPKSTDNLFVPNTAIVPVTFGLFNGQFVAVIISDHPRNPYIQQYTLSVQHQLAAHTTLEVNYVGSHAIHLLDRENINTPPLLTGTQLTTCQAAFAGLPATQGAYLANQCPFFTRLPHPNFGTLTINSVWRGYSNYNAGNIRLEHRSGDLALLTVYTYAKSLDDKSAAAGVGASGAGFAGHEDDLNPQLDYGPSDFSVKHRFVNSAIYILPFGQGQRFLSNISRPVDLLFGGWQVGAIVTFQTGFPFSVTATDPGAYLSFGMRANEIGNPNVPHKTINEWFNTAAFTQPAFGVYGSSGRNILTQPGINNWDMNLSKMVRFTERVDLQLRLETFNTFNHTQYGIDPTTTAALGPGQNAVDSALGDPNFGKVVSARPGRILQLGAKIVF
jgi:Carboxypeptidase regulatory-like domain/TonB dependent receptor